MEWFRRDKKLFGLTVKGKTYTDILFYQDYLDQVKRLGDEGFSAAYLGMLKMSMDEVEAFILSRSEYLESQGHRVEIQNFRDLVARIHRHGDEVLNPSKKLDRLGKLSYSFNRLEDVKPKNKVQTENDVNLVALAELAAKSSGK